MSAVTTYDDLARARGRRAAVDLLIELESDPEAAEACMLPATLAGTAAELEEAGDWRARQRNVLLEHVDRLHGDRLALEGFCSILSDLIASHCDGGAPDTIKYEKVVGLGREMIQLSHLK